MRHNTMDRKAGKATECDRVAEQISRDVRRCHDDELIELIGDHPQGTGGYAEQVFEEAVRELASRLERRPRAA
jgi:hypothetical protein